MLAKEWHAEKDGNQPFLTSVKVAKVRMVTKKLKCQSGWGSLASSDAGGESTLSTPGEQRMLARRARSVTRCRLASIPFEPTRTSSTNS